jgi:hypothetical protein
MQADRLVIREDSAMSVIEQLADFHRFIGQKLQEGGHDLSPEAALNEWRRENDLEWTEDDFAAVDEAIQAMENGDEGIPYDDFKREFNARHGLPPRQ